VTGAPDPLQSRAVLIGTGHYKALGEIGAVRNNLDGLAEVLRADRFWGLPSANCVVVEDPRTSADMLDPVNVAAQNATDTLLLYYAGHGLIDPWRSELHLALVESDAQRIYTAVPYSQIRDVLLDSRAARRIVILDCCYSGRALGQMASPAAAVVDEASAEGTYVLAASAENKAALAPPGAQYTAFTGEFLAILHTGIDGRGPLLDLDSIYQHLRAVMQGKGLPVPQKRDRNTAGQLALIRNQAFHQPPDVFGMEGPGRATDPPARVRSDAVTVRPVPRIDISSLNLGADLGSGDQGKVTAVNTLLVSGQPAALKTYSPGAVAALDTDALETIVGFPRQLGPDDIRWLQDNTAWPSIVVEDSGVTCGFLMRTVPLAYYFDFQTRTRGTRRVLADMAFLLNADAYVASAGMSVSERDRLMLLKSLAAALARLHALDVVVGDLTPKNLLFSLSPEPGCFLIDCDAMLVRGETVLPQMQTPDWEVPSGEPIATVSADAYKFALVAIRLFARDQSSYDSAALAALSPELGRLADISLGSDPSRRPRPAAWIRTLEGH